MQRTLATLAGVLAAAALGLSAYLLWASVSAGPVAGCNWSAFDCDAALTSRWGKWLGVPVAAGGIMVYAAALVGVGLAARGAAIGWRLLEATAVLAVGAGVWFIAVQGAALESFCLYCVLTHTAGLGMAVAVAVWRWSAGDSAGEPRAALAPVDGTPMLAPAESSPPALGAATLVGVLGVVALAAGQLLWAAPTSQTYTAELEDEFRFDSSGEQAPADPPEEPAQADPATEPQDAEPATSAAPRRKRGGSRVVGLLGGGLKIDAYEHPVLGSPEAPTLIVEMMDYACPHCREFDDKLAAALKRFDGQIGVIVMPVPGEISCNPYVRKARPKSVGACYAAKLSIAVAELAPESFEAFHHELLKSDSIPPQTTMLLAARRYVDADELRKRMQDADGRLAARVKQYVELSATLQRRGRFALPTQILGDKILVGPPESVDALCEKWTELLGVELPAGALPF